MRPSPSPVTATRLRHPSPSPVSGHPLPSPAAVGFGLVALGVNMLFDGGMLFSQARSKIVGYVIIESVHVLNVFRDPEPWPTLEELFDYPDDSFGRTVAEFLRARSLPFKTQYENHDAIHAILDYDVDSRGEMELQAFMWGNRSSSFAGRILFVWGGLMLPEYWQPMRGAYARGRAARPIEEAKLPHRLRETITNIRECLEPRAA